jgi:hypothetical protein
MNIDLYGAFQLLINLTSSIIDWAQQYHLLYLIVAALLVILALTLWLSYRGRRVIRASSIHQARHIRSARKLYKTIRAKKMLSHSELLDVARKVKGFDGWTFEMLVLIILRNSLPNVTHVGAIKLTGDYGADGVIVSKSKNKTGNEMFIVQSKFYTEYVSNDAIENIGKMASNFNKRKPKSKWHKVLGLPRGICKTPHTRAIAVLATSGKISEKGGRVAKHHGVTVLDWEMLVKLARR